ncbi:MAG: outer membrane beta-barrel family protein [Muribaculaceae bacterium]|nr:outer membrane beta-barrel family protein [Muribaculaceae bacterium]
MKKRLSVFILFCAALCPVVNAAITGRVISETGIGIEGVGCMCFALPDTVFVDMGVSDAEGRFELKEPSGNWYVDLERDGYESYIMAKSEYDAMGGASAAPEVVMIKEASELDELVVKADRGPMSVKNGVISYNDLNDVIATRAVTNAHELLAALPLISSIDGENFTLAGAPFGSVVYINGRQSMMDTSTLMDYLKSIAPEMVKSVEVIYTPSPKWKTRSSVINVVIRENSPYTFNGKVRASGTMKHTPSGTLGATVFGGLGKVNINAGYTFSSGKSIEKTVLTGKHTVGSEVYDVVNTDVTEGLRDSHRLYAMADWQINPANTLSVNYTGQFVPKRHTVASTSNSIYGDFGSISDSDNDFNAVSAYYSNTKGLSGGVDYSHYHATRSQRIVMEGIDPTTALTGNSAQNVDRFKVYFDGNISLKRAWTLSYGASFEDTRSASRMLNVSDSPDMEGNDIDSSISEYIASAYVGVQKPFFGNRLNIGAFLKGEMYKIAEYKKNQLLPTVNVTYVPSYTHIFQLSYMTYRNFPNYWTRQDYKTYTNPYYVEEGNPTLRPATYHQLMAMYMFKQKYVVNLSYYNVSDFFLDQIYQSPDALEAISRQANIDKYSVVLLTLNIPLSIGNRFYSTITLQGGPESLRSADWYGLSFSKKSFSGNIMIDNSFIVCQKPKIAVTLTGMYKTPSVVGLWERPHTWLLNAGLTGQFFNNSLSVSLKGWDLLETLIPRESIRLDKQWMDSDTNFYQRSITLTLAYNFKGYKDRKEKTYDTSRFGIE